MASSRNGHKRGNQSRRSRRWLFLFFLLCAVVFAAGGAALGIRVGYEYNLPKIQSLEDFRPDVITDIYSDDNKVIGEFAMERRIIVSLDEIPAHLQLAILAAEDDQFYNHSGINYLAIPRAAYRDIIAMSRAEGASTITQQLARMLMGNTEVTWDRKIKEALIAWKIEKHYTKHQILTLYCNQHYFGHGAYGVAAAADTFFKKKLSELTLDECAMIGGLPRSPKRYSPIMHPEAARSRRNYILERMAAERMISAAAAAEAKARPLTLGSRRRDSDTAPYFVEWVRQSLADRYSTDVIWRKGLRVYTTLNADMQKAGVKALRDGLRNYDKRHGWRGPFHNILKDPATSLADYQHPDWRLPPRPGDLVTGLVLNVGESDVTVRIGRYRASIGPREIAWTGRRSPSAILKSGDLATFIVTALDEEAQTAKVLLDQIPVVQGALVTLDNRTGEIKAMVGGYSYEASQFNRATQAQRQVGSTFKPFVYATALEKGMELNSRIIDAPVSYKDGLGRLYQPSNYDDKFKGEITLLQALVESRNVPTVKVASLIGIKEVLVMARRFGLEGRMDPYLPLALGACEVTPLEMASAFTVFPNLGVRVKPYFIRRIDDYDKVKKEEYFPSTVRVLEPEVASKMLQMLTAVVELDGGTARSARSLGRPVGGKTGTTNDFTDAWFVGFSPSITTAVWVGFDSRKTLGNKEAGGAVALPIWIQFMREVAKDAPLEGFPVVELTDASGIAPATWTHQGKQLFIEALPGATPPRPPSTP